MKNPAQQKKHLPEPLEVLEKQQKQKSTASGQGAVKESLPAEQIGESAGGHPTNQKQQQQAAIDSMRAYEAELKKKEAAAIRRLRQFKAELIAAAEDLKKREEEGKKRMEEEEEKKRKEKDGGMIGGGEALAATGASEKKPSGIFGLGRRKKSYIKATAERRLGPTK